jgi:hypothetical protein
LNAFVDLLELSGVCCEPLRAVQTVCADAFKRKCDGSDVYWTRLLAVPSERHVRAIKAMLSAREGARGAPLHGSCDYIWLGADAHGRRKHRHRGWRAPRA